MYYLCIMSTESAIVARPKLLRVVNIYFVLCPVTCHGTITHHNLYVYLTSMDGEMSIRQDDRIIKVRRYSITSNQQLSEKKT